MISHNSILGLSGVLVLTAAAAHLSPAWTAKLSPVGGSSVSGTATVNALGTDSATASINIMGAKSGQYPWHVHTGKCGSEGAVVGNEAGYPALSVQSGGQASAQATIAFKPAAGTDYSINVHKSLTDKAVIACGNLNTSGSGMSGDMNQMPSTQPTQASQDTSMKPATQDTTMKPAKP